jgi:hypothetical protein
MRSTTRRVSSGPAPGAAQLELELAVGVGGEQRLKVGALHARLRRRAVDRAHLDHHGAAAVVAPGRDLDAVTGAQVVLPHHARGEERVGGTGQVAVARLAHEPAAVLGQLDPAGDLAVGDRGGERRARLGGGGVLLPELLPVALALAAAGAALREVAARVVRAAGGGTAVGLIGPRVGARGVEALRAVVALGVVPRVVVALAVVALRVVPLAAVVPRLPVAALLVARAVVLRVLLLLRLLVPGALGVGRRRGPGRRPARGRVARRCRVPVVGGAGERTVARRRRDVVAHPVLRPLGPRRTGPRHTVRRATVGGRSVVRPALVAGARLGRRGGRRRVRRRVRHVGGRLARGAGAAARPLGAGARRGPVVRGRRRVDPVAVGSRLCTGLGLDGRAGLGPHLGRLARCLRAAPPPRPLGRGRRVGPVVGGGRRDGGRGSLLVAVRVEVPGVSRQFAGRGGRAAPDGTTFGHASRDGKWRAARVAGRGGTLRRARARARTRRGAGRRRVAVRAPEARPGRPTGRTNQNNAAGTRRGRRVSSRTGERPLMKVASRLQIEAVAASVARGRACHMWAARGLSLVRTGGHRRGAARTGARRCARAADPAPRAGVTTRIGRA